MFVNFVKQYACLYAVRIVIKHYAVCVVQFSIFFNSVSTVYFILFFCQSIPILCNTIPTTSVAFHTTYKFHVFPHLLCLRRNVRIRRQNHRWHEGDFFIQNITQRLCHQLLIKIILVIYFFVYSNI